MRIFALFTGECLGFTVEFYSKFCLIRAVAFNF